MKTIHLASLILAAGLFSSAARAQVLTLEVSPTTLETWISNNSGSSIAMDGYQLTSSLGLLNQTTWVSIEDSVIANPSAVAAALGPGALTFQEVPGLNPFFMLEVNPSGVGTWLPGTRWSIGYPFGTSTSVVGSIESDIAFEYTGPSIGVVTGPVVVLPEPTSLGLMLTTVGCAAGILRRQRANRG